MTRCVIEADVDQPTQKALPRAIFNMSLVVKMSSRRTEQLDIRTGNLWLRGGFLDWLVEKQKGTARF